MIAYQQVKKRTYINIWYIQCVFFLNRPHYNGSPALDVKYFTKTIIAKLFAVPNKNINGKYSQQ